MCDDRAGRPGRAGHGRSEGAGARGGAAATAGRPAGLSACSYPSPLIRVFRPAVRLSGWPSFLEDSDIGRHLETAFEPSSARLGYRLTRISTDSGID